MSGKLLKHDMHTFTDLQASQLQQKYKFQCLKCFGSPQFNKSQLHQLEQFQTGCSHAFFSVSTFSSPASFQNYLFTKTIDSILEGTYFSTHVQKVERIRAK